MTEQRNLKPDNSELRGELNRTSRELFEVEHDCFNNHQGPGTSVEDITTDDILYSSWRHFGKANSRPRSDKALLNTKSNDVATLIIQRQEFVSQAKERINAAQIRQADLRVSKIKPLELPAQRKSELLAVASRGLLTVDPKAVDAQSFMQDIDETIRLDRIRAAQQHNENIITQIMQIRNEDGSLQVGSSIEQHLRNDLSLRYIEIHLDQNILGQLKRLFSELKLFDPEVEIYRNLGGSNTNEMQVYLATENDGLLKFLAKLSEILHNIDPEFPVVKYDSGMLDQFNKRLQSHENNIKAAIKAFVDKAK